MMAEIIHKDEKIMWAKSLKGSTWVHVSEWMEYVSMSSLRLVRLNLLRGNLSQCWFLCHVVFTNLFNKQELWYPSHELELIC